MSHSIEGLWIVSDRYVGVHTAYYGLYSDFWGAVAKSVTICFIY